MIKILFFIHDLGQGGAEKVLVNLVNNMDREKFDITVIALFAGGVNAQFLKDHIHYQAVFNRSFPGNSKMMKLLTPGQLHKLYIKDHYDIEVAYLEGPSARVISGCSDKKTKRVCWIHSTFTDRKKAASAFRSVREAMCCYNSFDRIIGVSATVLKAFQSVVHACSPACVLYNTNNSELILRTAKEPLDLMSFKSNEIRLVSVGKIAKVKGYNRLIKIVKRLRDDGLPVHLYLLGEGPDKDALIDYAKENDLQDQVTFLGYQTNPYKYVANCDLFVCSSYSEGFSTAATEALIVGIPVCTVEVSGMKELLGENNEYGIVTENSEEALYQAVKQLLENPTLLKYYRGQAEIRGKSFNMENTVKAVEDMFGCLME